MTDVQEAADARGPAKAKATSQTVSWAPEPSFRLRVRRHRKTAPTCGDTVTAPVAGSISNGTPVGSTRNTAEPRRGAISHCQEYGWPGRRRAAATIALQLIDHSRARRAAASAARRHLRAASASSDFRICCKQEARRGAVASLDQHRRGHRLEPVGRAGLRRGPPKPRRRGLQVAQLPVMDEGDVVVILPLRRLRGDPLAQQRDRLIRPARSAGIRLRSGISRRTGRRS